ncbi:DUF29 domain-containing protein [Cysteiniphilum sp. 6C5]|uniref:DUF29 domain-containing protein n=1 Tax=unclassified Cysteiniphilum TaxID=2610889 RepID=UPI003F8283EE
MNISQLYEKDYYQWTVETAKALKAKDFNHVDIDHLVEEVESMGASERRQLQSRLEVLLMHLLKWQYQPEYENKGSWLRTIREQRKRLNDLLHDNPSLKSKIDSVTLKAYDYAKDSAVYETGLKISNFPIELPYTLEQILNEEYYPD